MLPLRRSNSSPFAVMLLKICKLFLEVIHSTIQNTIWKKKTRGKNQKLMLHLTEIRVTKLGNSKIHQLKLNMLETHKFTIP